MSVRKTTVVWLKRIARVIWEVPLSLKRVFIIVFSLFVAAVIVTMVIFRYFLQIPFMWWEELVLYTVFWFYLLGAAYATYDRSHIKGGIVQLFTKNRPRVLASFQVGVTLVCLGLSGLLTVWGYTNFTWQLEANSRSTQLFLPLAYANLSLPVGFALMAVYFFTEFIDSVRDLVRGVPVNPAPGSRQ